MQDFVKFKKIWHYLDKEHLKKLQILPGVEEELKTEAVDFLTDLLTNPNNRGCLPRDDYEEAARMTLFLLGGEVPKKDGMVFWGCGATHKARFMQHIIYSSKIYSF